MRKVTLFLAATCLSVLSFAQSYPDNENFKVGLNAGLNLTSTLGSELDNARIKYGFVVGMYYRQPLNRKKIHHVQFDVRAAFKGATYNNPGEDRYRKLNLFYIDAPLTDYIQLGSESKHFLVFGAQYSQLMNALMFINPVQSKPISEGVNFLNYDVAALAGYHYNGYYAGWSFILTAGLLDINDGFNMPNILPATGTGNPIRNISFTTLVYF
jgi:hypothetical protein